MSKVIVPSSYPTYEQMHHSVATNIDPTMVTKIEHSSPPHHSPYAEGDPLVDGYTDYSFTHGMAVPMAVAYTHQPPPYMATARVSYHPFVSEKPVHPSSPESTSTTSTPHTPPLRSQASNESLSAASMASYSNTAARVKETIAKASAVPMELYHTEFLTYSKEAYERKNDNRKVKRKRVHTKEDVTFSKKGKKRSTSVELEDDDEDDEEIDDLSNAELRRQIHIQSEQKRRAQIKDGFEELKKHLPGCQNKKMSKAAMLTRTVQQIQHLKKTQTDLLAEVERLVAENESLKKFQHGVLQRQAMEKMYAF